MNAFRDRVGAGGALVHKQPVHRPALPGVDLLHLADGAVVHQLHGGAIDRVRLDLIAHLRDDAVLLGRPAHLPRLEHGVSQRLLAEDVLAELQRGQGDRRVHMVGRGDDDRIKAVRAIEQAAPVGMALRLRVLLGRPSQVFRPFVDIAERDDLDLRAGRDRRVVRPSLAADADRRDAKLLVGPEDARPACGGPRSGSTPRRPGEGSDDVKRARTS